MHWLFLLALAACDKRLPTKWEGVPIDGNVRCSWNKQRLGVCVGAGRVYQCVMTTYEVEDDTYQDIVTCAATNNPVLPEDPDDKEGQ